MMSNKLMTNQDDDYNQKDDEDMINTYWLRKREGTAKYHRSYLQSWLTNDLQMSQISPRKRPDLSQSNNHNRRTFNFEQLCLFHCI